MCAMHSIALAEIGGRLNALKTVIHRLYVLRTHYMRYEYIYQDPSVVIVAIKPPTGVIRNTITLQCDGNVKNTLVLRKEAY